MLGEIRLGLDLLRGLVFLMSPQNDRVDSVTTIIEQVHIDSVRCVCMETIVEGTETGEKFKIECPYTKPIEIKLRANKEIHLQLNPNKDFYTLDRSTLLTDNKEQRSYRLPDAQHYTSRGALVTNKTEFVLQRKTAKLIDMQYSTQTYPMKVTSNFSCYNPIVPTDTIKTPDVKYLHKM